MPVSPSIEGGVGVGLLRRAGRFPVRYDYGTDE